MRSFINQHLILKILITFVMVSTILFAGCGSDDSSESDAEPTSAPTAGSHTEQAVPANDDIDTVAPEPAPEGGIDTPIADEPAATSEPLVEPIPEPAPEVVTPPPPIEDATAPVVAIDTSIIISGDEDSSGVAESTDSSIFSLGGGSAPLGSDGVITGSSVPLGSEDVPETTVAAASTTVADKSLEPMSDSYSIDQELQSGILTAGDIDDNLNFAYYLRYYHRMLRQDSLEVLPSVNIEDRVSMKVLDGNGQPIGNAIINIYPQGESLPIIETYAGTNGVFHFFPTIDGAGKDTKFIVETAPPDANMPYTYLEFDLDEMASDQPINIVIDDARSQLPDSMDLMIVIDTTGSMKDELKYLTTEFKSIVDTVQSQHPYVNINFGLVAYRDIGDQYVVRDFDFTNSVDIMQEHLAFQKADGGGDYPEAMDQALETAINAQWRGGNTARVILLVADAPPHDENIWHTLEQANIARQQGIRIYPVAASGVKDTAEFLMRLSACITQGRYIFLTDDSGVGNTHAEPKIPCYVVTRLDDLIVRIINSEISGVRFEPIPENIIRTVGICDSGVCIPN